MAVLRTFRSPFVRFNVLDCNCQRDKGGNSLPHYTPCPTPGSAGVKVFAYHLPAGHNIYASPPFVLIGPPSLFLIRISMARSHSLLQTFYRGRSGKRPSTPSLSTDYYFWTRRAQIECCFSPAFILESGYHVFCNGISGRSDVSVSGNFFLVISFIPRFQSLGKLPDDALHVCIQMTSMLYLMLFLSSLWIANIS